MLGRGADIALVALLVLAPVAGGGWPRMTLVPLLVLALIAFVLASLERGQANKTICLFGLVATLWLLGLWTALQAVRLDPAWTAWLSPLAAQRYADVEAPFLALSYEVGATWREAAKYSLYAIVAVVAWSHARRRKSASYIAQALVAAGLLSALVALVHRLLGIDRLFGLLPAVKGLEQSQITTFVNPNHAAAFMTLCTFAGLGWGLHTKRRGERVAAFVSAAICTSVSVLALSKGGLVGLAFGLALFAFIAWRGGHLRRKTPRRVIGAFAGLTIFSVVAAAAVRPDIARLEVVDRGVGWLGLSAKFAGMRDVAPLIADHPWTGIGRGAFVSAYPAYQSDPLFQLTYHFPENFILQWSAEWGVVVAGFLVLAMLYALGRRLMAARRLLSVALLCGVAGVVVHNLVDFNLELPGVAIPVIACVAGCGYARQRGLQIEPFKLSGIACALLLVVPAVASLAFAFAEPTLDADVRVLDAAVQAAGKKEPVDRRALAVLAHRHPASAHIAAGLGYLAELATPPDYEEAATHARRALELAPQQVDAYLLAGRLLVKRGFRNQGFAELRTAWEHAAERRAVVIDQVLSLARTVDEAKRAVPRDEFSQPQPRELGRLAQRLLFHHKPETAAAVLKGVDLDGATIDGLLVVADAAGRAGLAELSLQALEQLQVQQPQNTKLTMRRAQTLMRLDRGEEADILLEPLQSQSALMLKLTRAEQREDWPAARELIKTLRRRPGRDARLWLFEARIERSAGRPTRAVAVLGDGLQRLPHDVQLRFFRAQLLQSLGRHHEALTDADAVLRRDPKHPGARALRAQLQTSDKLRE